MKLNTMAAVMSFVSRMENDSSVFYRRWAEKYPELQDTFLSRAKENEKFEKTVKQTYFGVITDTLEACFSFQGLDTEDYEFQPTLPENASISEVLKTAQEMEDRSRNFYLRTAEVSEGLMADIPRLLRKIAKKKEERCLPEDLT